MSTKKVLALALILSILGCGHSLSFDDQKEACLKVRQDVTAQMTFIRDFLNKCEEFCGELKDQVSWYAAYEARAERICPGDIYTFTFLNDLQKTVVNKNEGCGCIPPETLRLESKLENIAPPGARYKEYRKKQ